MLGTALHFQRESDLVALILGDSVDLTGMASTRQRCGRVWRRKVWRIGRDDSRWSCSRARVAGRPWTRPWRCPDKSAEEDNRLRIAFLQLRAPEAHAEVVRQVVSAERRLGTDVGSQSKHHGRTRSPVRSMWSAASVAAASEVLPRCRATMYWAYQSDQWCFGAAASYSP